MKSAHIAVDIGASSGRLILGWLDDGQLKLKEIHRFKNKMTYRDGHYIWDIDGLFEAIMDGLKKAALEDVHIKTMGIDTWGVDYALVDQEGNRVAPVYAYRDHRTDGTMSEVFSKMSKDIIYEETGIQFMQFNTLFQLYEHLKSSPNDLVVAKSLMLVPDYLHYRLTGRTSVEYTNASTTQMLDVKKRNWSDSLIEFLGVKAELLPEIIEPGTVLGSLKADLQSKTGIGEIKVIAPATHDTGSAIVSVPALDESFAYISSGTWSLMGIESPVPIHGEVAKSYNFTNEGGVMKTYRVLKNIMGLWLIQEVQRIQENAHSFAEYVELAQECEPFRSIINPNDDRFLNPENMVVEIQAYCGITRQPIPETPGQIARCIFESLALCYRATMDEIREVSDQKIERIHIVGGGCQNQFLNQLTADINECPVYGGPVEATAIGNLAMQMVADNPSMTLTDVRRTIMDSFDIDVYQPSMTSQQVEEVYSRYRRYQSEY